MRAYTTGKQDYIAKMLIVGIFVGLFFSNAEGISLLPFPDSTKTIATEKFEDGSLQTSYDLTVKPTRSTIADASKTKSFKSALDVTVYNADPRLFVDTAGLDSEWLTIPASPLAANSATTRGPPLV